MDCGGVMKDSHAHKAPKRILHFCDGIIEEYSSDDDESDEVDMEHRLAAQDPKSLSWKEWFWYQTLFVGVKALKVADYAGETFANFLGISKPVYEYEIECAKEQQLEEEKERQRMDEENAGWKLPQVVDSVVDTQDRRESAVSTVSFELEKL